MEVERQRHKAQHIKLPVGILRSVQDTAYRPQNEHKSQSKVGVQVAEIGEFVDQEGFFPARVPPATPRTSAPLTPPLRGLELSVALARTRDDSEHGPHENVPLHQLRSLR